MSNELAPVVAQWEVDSVLSEARRANAMIRSNHLNDPLQPLLTADGLVSPGFPGDLSQLFGLDGDAAMTLNDEYGMNDIVEGKERNLNRFMQFCGISYQMVSVSFSPFRVFCGLPTFADRLADLAYAPFGEKLLIMIRHYVPDQLGSCRCPRHSLGWPALTPRCHDFWRLDLVSLLFKKHGIDLRVFFLLRYRTWLAATSDDGRRPRERSS